MRDRSYFRICPRCGGHLDPGERCDCDREETRPVAIAAEAKEREARSEPVAARAS